MRDDHYTRQADASPIRHAGRVSSPCFHGENGRRAGIAIDEPAVPRKVFNVVDFGLPSKTPTGSGFGIISQTAANLRQIQFPGEGDVLRSHAQSSSRLQPSEHA
jgi:hypothetical protein